MTYLPDLYQFAESRGIDVDWFHMERATSLSMPFPDSSCCIAIDPWRMETIAQETVALAHELGHCETGNFYNPHAVLDVRKKHENRADKWAIQRLIPQQALDEAVANGCTEVWQLAEYFNVTEEFVHKTICWYAHGNLAYAH
ncbi:MAG: ImmA/IrrE family metallo-endopeptidase [Oscillibacter sp.]|nr:ImmA/IrrE family metallo-endopeptidase [Oscillibacter sp.]